MRPRTALSGGNGGGHGRRRHDDERVILAKHPASKPTTSLRRCPTAGSPFKNANCRYAFPSEIPARPEPPVDGAAAVGRRFRERVFIGGFKTQRPVPPNDLHHRLALLVGEPEDKGLTRDEEQTLRKFLGWNMQKVGRVAYSARTRRSSDTG